MKLMFIYIESYLYPFYVDEMLVSEFLGWPVSAYVARLTSNVYKRVFFVNYLFQYMDKSSVLASLELDDDNNIDKRKKTKRK